ncbi:hypothetical protein NX059_004766 [Plenodomus lindquistii]|nr:hypothetical protein NX059_004766 [Plenodomus lindquistii]
MFSPSSPIHLEGTTLEGGGQLLRLALSLSSLTSKPVAITNIRGKRHGGGGLNSQHLTCVHWLGQASNAQVHGATLKSRDVTFTPNAARPHKTLGRQEIHINQTTPGSVNLVLQAILPYVLFSGFSGPVQLRITGGTNVSNSPSIEYITQVLLPTLRLIGIPPITSTLHSRGWSQGSTTLGSVTFTVTPLSGPLPVFCLTDRGSITTVTVTIIAPKNTEQQFRDELYGMFERRETRFFGTSTTTIASTDITITFEDSGHDKRYYILMVATTSTGKKLGRDWLYDQAVQPGKTDNIVPAMVKKVSDDMLAEIEHAGCVDEYLRDQLVVFQALADGKSKVYGGKRNGVLVAQSLHAKTAQWVASESLGVDFDAEGDCEGVGFGRKRMKSEGSDDEGVTERLARLDITEMNQT